MSEVTAEVVESPKPVRPELWLVVYESGPRDDRSWFTDVYPNEAMATEALQGRLGKWPTAFIATVPASTAAPEPDWVAELCVDEKHHAKSWRNPTSGNWCVVCIRSGVDVEFGIGDTQQLAAKACVMKLRSGGAT